VVISITDENETTLIQQAQNGNTRAFEEIVRRHYAPVVNIAYRMCGQTALAEDMAQETFLRAWTKLSSFRLSGSMKNWLYRIAVNATLDFLRRKTETPVDDEVIQLVTDPALDPETALVKKEQAEHLQRMLNDLPEAARTVLVLREYGGLSYHEIAAALDVPLGTVMSRLNYARTRLRNLLKEDSLAELVHA
jgi:RNA polymerase sigma-70 factor (ECF subfamily)